ncbi:MAG: hypothetical protein RLZZ528_1887 [Pseudomonadota bacterium]
MTARLSVLLVLAASPLLADSPEVVSARAFPAGDYWTIEVTIAHPDTGWDHFAKGWSVSTEDGTELGYRELAHPHVDEQPFTRSLEAVQIPEGTRVLVIRAKCSMTGWASETFRLTLDD